MAKKKESIYKKKLKDINKDGKTNFKDMWLGDAVGADGKIGVQGPGLKASNKGARREMGEDKPKPKTKSKAPTTSKPDAKKRTVKTRGGRPKSAAPSTIKTSTLPPYRSESDKAAESKARPNQNSKATPGTQSFRDYVKSKGGNPSGHGDFALKAKYMIMWDAYRRAEKSRAKTKTKVTPKPTRGSRADLNKGGMTRVRYQPTQRTTPKFPDRGR
jgi:hypothetical protein